MEVAMLVLTRRIGEQIVIGDGVIVSIERVTGERVKFGIQAPADVKILRGELNPCPPAPPAPPTVALNPATAHMPCNA